MTTPLFDTNVPEEAPLPPRTERDMLDLIHARFGRAHNGSAPRYVIAEHVGIDPTWPTRILDALVQDTWRSTGYALHGIEIKCSRSDLARELADPAKAEAFSEHLDYFWLGVPDRKLTKGLALPSKWGVLACNGTGYLRQVRAATRLRMAVTGYRVMEPLPRATQVAMLRATRKTYERQAS